MSPLWNLKTVRNGERRFTGMRLTASAKGSKKSNVYSPKRAKNRSGQSHRMKKPTTPATPFAACIDTGGSVDLILLKIYKVRADAEGKKHGLIRVWDESGEDYLYPKDCFCPIRAPRNLFSRVKQSE